MSRGRIALNLLFIAAAAGIVLAQTSVSLVETTDYSLFGNTRTRNMVSPAKGLPEKWNVETGENVLWAAELGSLIEVVNRFGSFFYGSILGVFVLAAGFSWATANGAFIGLIAGMVAVAWAASFTNVAFLWHNVIGVVVAVAVGLVVSLVDPARTRQSPIQR